MWRFSPHHEAYSVEAVERLCVEMGLVLGLDRRWVVALAGMVAAVALCSCAAYLRDDEVSFSPLPTAIMWPLRSLRLLWRFALRRRGTWRLLVMA